MRSGELKGERGDTPKSVNAADAQCSSPRGEIRHQNLSQKGATSVIVEASKLRDLERIVVWEGERAHTALVE
jgi:hypothetical protein